MSILQQIHLLKDQLSLQLILIRASLSPTKRQTSASSPCKASISEQETMPPSRSILISSCPEANHSMLHHHEQQDLLVVIPRRFSGIAIGFFRKLSPFHPLSKAEESSSSRRCLKKRQWQRCWSPLLSSAKFSQVLETNERDKNLPESFGPKKMWRL